MREILFVTQGLACVRLAARISQYVQKGRDVVVAQCFGHITRRTVLSEQGEQAGAAPAHQRGTGPASKKKFLGPAQGCMCLKNNWFKAVGQPRAAREWISIF